MADVKELRNIKKNSMIMKHSANIEKCGAVSRMQKIFLEFL